jgi:hypothetical protein
VTTSIRSTPRRRAVCAALVALFGIATAISSGKDLEVHLTGAEETPPLQTVATGSGHFQIRKNKSVSGEVRTRNVDGIAAHIHVGAAGEAGPPIITLTKTAPGIWKVPSDAKLTPEQYENFRSGRLYVNVHSEEHKSGEIRGQLKP